MESAASITAPTTCRESSRGIRQRNLQTNTRRIPPYNVIIENDEHHTFEWVVQVLKKALGYSVERAHQLTNLAHRTGRAIVCTTHKERAELKRDQILAYGCDFRIASCTSSMRALIEPAEG